MCFLSVLVHPSWECMLVWATALSLSLSVWNGNYVAMLLSAGKMVVPTVTH